MKLYLSSFGLGDASDRLREMASGRRLGFIPNALDHVEEAARSSSNAQRLGELRELGVSADVIDLRDYFGRRNELRSALAEFGGVWVRGGNTFVLRQAMSLSGFDDLLAEVVDSDFLYAGYSAGACVLAPELRGLQQVDDPSASPYDGSFVIWEGLALLDYLVLPHYESDHPESADIAKEVEFCRREAIPFRTLRDGEVIIIEDLVRPRSA